MKAAVFLLLAIPPVILQAAAGPRVEQHMILLQPADNRLEVRESMIVSNPTTSPLPNEGPAAARFYVPPQGLSTLKAVVLHADGASEDLKVLPAGAPGVFRVAFTLPPGESRFDITYSLPFKFPGSFQSRVLHSDGAVSLVLHPALSVKAAGLEFLGVEPRTRFSIYSVRPGNYKLDLDLTASPSAQPLEEPSSSLDQILPPIYDHAVSIVLLTLSIAALGFILLWRKSAPAR